MATIARLETGNINPRIDTVRSLIRAFQDAGLKILQDEPRGGFTLVVGAEVIQEQVG